jgi:ankyrin repeat protein
VNPIPWQLGTVLILALTLGACGKQPIEEAVQKNDRKAVSEALSKGADVNAKLSNGDTPLLVAARAKNRQETAKFLVRHGASLDAKDESGATAIDYAMRSGDTRFANDLKLAAQMRTK